MYCTNGLTTFADTHSKCLMHPGEDRRLNIPTCPPPQIITYISLCLLILLLVERSFSNSHRKGTRTNQSPSKDIGSHFGFSSLSRVVVDTHLCLKLLKLLWGFHVLCMPFRYLSL